ncbi:UNVERIFIED_CONTAM: hypothetical protein FKN15_071996 [Acipenser sinensis]
MDFSQQDFLAFILLILNSFFVLLQEEGELIVEGLLNISWGLRRPIRLQMTMSESISHVLGRGGTEMTNTEEETPQLMRTKSDASFMNVQRRSKYRTCGEMQRIKRHTFSINGHFYNHKVENTSDEFALYLVHETGERTKLRDTEYSLISRILHGPCEKIAKIFLMETDLGEEVTYDGGSGLIIWHIRITAGRGQQSRGIRLSVMAMTRRGNVIVEIGANWIHGPSKANPVFQLACEHGLLDAQAMSEENQALDVGGHPSFQSSFYSSSGKKLTPDLTEPVSQLFSTLLEKSREFFQTEKEPYPSVGEFLKKEIAKHVVEWKDDAETKKLKLALLTMMLKLECCVSGTHSMDLVGLGAFGGYKTLPGLDCTFPGYGHVLCGWIAGHESEYMETLSDTEVKNSMTEAIRKFSGYLKEHYETLINPPLPLSKVHSIQRMGFGTNNKIFLEFEEPFWEPDCEVINLIWEDETPLADVKPDVNQFWMKKIFGFTVQHPPERQVCRKAQESTLAQTVLIRNMQITDICLVGQNSFSCYLYGHVLCGWIAGHESEYMETLSDTEVKNSMTEVIRKFSGNPSITPKRILQSKWHSDPYTKGSYSYVAVGCSGSDIENIVQPLPLQETDTKRVLKQLKREGVGNVLFADCLTQRDENIKKVVPVVTELIESSPRFHRTEVRKASKVGGEPGITKAVLSKIQVCERPLIYLLDTPGVLPPKIESLETGMKLSLCGTILDHLVGEDVIADYLLYTLNKHEQLSYVDKYELGEPCDDIQHVLKKIAVKLGKTQRVKAITGVGDITITVPNYSAAAYDFIRVFRKGELGRVMLD